MPDVVGLYGRFGVRLRLPDPVPTHGWVSVRCFVPGHQDRHASARVHLDSGGFRCFGCFTAGGILRALEILGAQQDHAVELALSHGVIERKPRPSPPLFTNPRPNPKPNPEPKFEGRVDYDAVATGSRARLEREWVYTDSAGKPVGRVKRIDLVDGSKRIWQERPENERWLPGMQGIRLPLYQLPLVRAAARQGQRVLVVEGEKACDGLERIGLFATTNAGGAGKWDTEYSQALVGAKVTAICDSDLAGRLHAIQVTQSLLAAEVSVLMPLDLFPVRTDGADVVDYLAEIAAASRAAVGESTAQGSLRQRLRWHMDKILAAQLPADADELERLAELVAFRADPAGRVLLACSKCGQRRPQRVASGLAFCACGGFTAIGAAT